MDWITRPTTEQRIKTLQNMIDELNKGLESTIPCEKGHLDEAATELEESKEFEHLESMETSLQQAKNMRPHILEYVAVLEGRMNKEIQALHDRALTKPQKTRRHFCFFF